MLFPPLKWHFLLQVTKCDISLKYHQVCLSSRLKNVRSNFDRVTVSNKSFTSPRPYQEVTEDMSFWPEHLWLPSSSDCNPSRWVEATPEEGVRRPPLWRRARRPRSAPTGATSTSARWAQSSHPVWRGQWLLERLRSNKILEVPHQIVHLRVILGTYCIWRRLWMILSVAICG